MSKARTRNTEIADRHHCKVRELTLTAAPPGEDIGVLNLLAGLAEVCIELIELGNGGVVECFEIVEEILRDLCMY